MIDKVSHGLMTMAAISMAILPVNAMETSSAKSLVDHNPIKENITTNGRKCIDLGAIQWCINFPD